MANDRDRNLVRETYEALLVLNKKIEECRRLEIFVKLTPRLTSAGYTADFWRTEMIHPARDTMDGDD